MNIGNIAIGALAGGLKGGVDNKKEELVRERVRGEMEGERQRMIELLGLKEQYRVAAEERIAANQQGYKMKQIEAEGKNKLAVESAKGKNELALQSAKGRDALAVAGAKPVKDPKVTFNESGVGHVMIDGKAFTIYTTEAAEPLRVDHVKNGLEKDVSIYSGLLDSDKTKQEKETLTIKRTAELEKEAIAKYPTSLPTAQSGAVAQGGEGQGMKDLFSRVKSKANPEKEVAVQPAKEPTKPLSLPALTGEAQAAELPKEETKADKVISGKVKVSKLSLDELQEIKKEIPAEENKALVKEIDKAIAKKSNKKLYSHDSEEGKALMVKDAKKAAAKGYKALKNRFENLRNN